jgi:hypothetical protein
VEFNATSFGEKKRAFVPDPSTHPAVSAPAKVLTVVTAPLGTI